jgi:hypothetical protein
MRTPPKEMRDEERLIQASEAALARRSVAGSTSSTARRNNDARGLV